MSTKLVLANKEFDSRLIIGTGKFASAKALEDAVIASGTQIATLAIKRVDIKTNGDNILAPLRKLNIELMPNTSGARTAGEAVFAAKLAREALETNWIKVEVHPEQKYLLPDPLETYKACKELKALGFEVFAYCSADPLLCKALDDLGVAAIMPLGAPIGSARGLESLPFLKIIIQQCKAPVIVDAGIGTPSDAALAFEIGAQAVMVNTAIAAANNPTLMAEAFKYSCLSGRLGYEAGLASSSTCAIATSPMEQFLSEAML